MNHDGVRVALVHALAESVAPIHAAFEEHWPDASPFDLLETSLAPDLHRAGELQSTMLDRFLSLGRYAAGTTGVGGKTAAVMFTCSAFGPAIDAVAADLAIPVLRPNEAAFEEALAKGSRIGLLVTFPPSLPALSHEFHSMARWRDRRVEVVGTVAEGALAALKAGNGALHDSIVARAAASLVDVDCVVLGQFSLARAADAVEAVRRERPITTPHSAVRKLKVLLGTA
jgi:Asp/Glu/hydantoin racemase